MNDLISREKLIDYLYENNVRADISIEDLADEIFAEPKVGRWIDHKKLVYTDPEIWGYSQECSLCGFTLGAKEYNYCPNCGAKMIRE